jgi:hypothetical protein
MFGNFAKIGRAAGASPIWQISKHHDWILLNVNIIYSLAKAQSCQIFNQNLVLLSIFSSSTFVKAKFGAFVRIFIEFL